MFINFLIHRQYSLFLSLGNSAPRARKHGALYNYRFMKIGISSKKFPRFSLHIREIIGDRFARDCAHHPLGPLGRGAWFNIRNDLARVLPCRNTVEKQFSLSDASWVASS